MAGAATAGAASLGRLKRRPEFLRVAGSGRKWVTPGLILQVARRSSPAGESENMVRVGFTVSRKVGNAVARNRARRRLKAAAAEVLPLAAEAGCDYVIVGRGATLKRRWPELKRDLETAAQGLRRQGGRRPGRAKQVRPGEGRQKRRRR